MLCLELGVGKSTSSFVANITDFVFVEFNVLLISHEILFRIVWDLAALSSFRGERLLDENSHFTF